MGGESRRVDQLYVLQHTTVCTYMSGTTRTQRWHVNSPLCTDMLQSGTSLTRHVSITSNSKQQHLWHALGDIHLSCACYLGDTAASNHICYMTVTLVTISAKYTPFPNMYPVCREQRDQCSSKGSQRGRDNVRHYVFAIQQTHPTTYTHTAEVQHLATDHSHCRWHRCSLKEPLVVQSAGLER